jgi:hypothetical protein
MCVNELQKRPAFNQLNKDQMEFFQSQSKAASLPKKGMRWTPAAK